MSRRILLLLAHPALERSRAGVALLRAAREVSAVTVHDLYEAYPHGIVNARHERKLLSQHDVVVMQHPLYWYSCPALLKEWMDHVLAAGWAYGPGGTALHGKALMVCVTTGGPADAYRPGGRNRFSIRQLLAPIDQTAYLCGMGFLAPFVVHDAMAQSPTELNAHAQAYGQVLTALAANALDVEAAQRAEYITDVLPTAVRHAG